MKQSRLRDRKLGIKKTEQKRQKSFVKPFFALFLLFLILLLFIYIILPKNWNGKEKISIAFQKEDGIGEIIILDPKNSSITSIEIPSDTELNAANQLGSWKMESITKLAEDEKLDGSLLKNSIIKSFNLPIDYWAGENFINLSSGNFMKELKSVFNNTNTNLSIIDKLRIAAFSLGIGNSQRFSVDLSKTNFINKTQLKDGSLGFVINEKTPPKIEVFFALPNLRQNLLINNKSNRNWLGEMITETVEALGLNVASIEKNKEDDFNCVVTGENKDVVVKLARIFVCDTVFTKPQNNFDLQIDIGTKFTERF